MVNVSFFNLDREGQGLAKEQADRIPTMDMIGARTGRSSLAMTSSKKGPGVPSSLAPSSSKQLDHRSTSRVTSDDQSPESASAMDIMNKIRRIKEDIEWRRAEEASSDRERSSDSPDSITAKILAKKASHQQPNRGPGEEQNSASRSHDRANKERMRSSGESEALLNRSKSSKVQTRFLNIRYI